MAPDLETYRRFRERGGIADLSARAKLRVVGADRVRYLNGQVTANVNRLAGQESLPACVTTAKGKLSADIFISAEPAAMVAAGVGGLIVDAERELRESLLARLGRYIIADDVVLEDLTEVYGLLHFLPAAGAALDSFRGLFRSPLEPIKSRRFGRAGYDFFLPIAAVENQIADFFLPHHAILDEALCEMLRIEAGVPRWGRELNEQTLPPEAGLDRTHIDYHKGCYVGQEVISRLKSVGHVNRLLTGFISSGGVPLTSGTDIFSGTSPTTSPGTLTSATWSFALEKPIALGYLKRSAPPTGLFVRASGGDTLPITAHALPFTS